MQHLAQRVDTFKTLRDRIGELEEEVLQLREMLVPKIIFAPQLRLQPYERKVLAFIFARYPNFAPKERIHLAVWPQDDAPDIKIIDVMACKIRRELGRFGIELQTVWGQGYALAKRDRDMIAAANAGEILLTPVEVPILTDPKRRALAARIAREEKAREESVSRRIAATPAPAPVLALPAPEAEPSALQIRTVKGFASAGQDAPFIARECDLPVAVVKAILKGR